MKHISISPLNCSISPPLSSLAVFLVMVFFMAVDIKAQGYDPCPFQLTAVPSCSNAPYSCNISGIPTCSEGYCWATGKIGDNEGIPANGLVSGRVIEIGSIYTITKSAKFVNCQFYMHGGSSININPSENNTLSSQVIFEGCTFFECGYMWRGITVNTSNVNSGGLFLSMTSCIVQGAYIGVTLDETMAQYLISGCGFKNNHIGISNRRQNGSALNAVLVLNTFLCETQLPALDPSMSNLPLPDAPFTHAGVKYRRTTSSIGVAENPQTGNTENTFTCLTNGIITEDGVVISSNNAFNNIRQYGIWSRGGGMTAIDCIFDNPDLTGKYAIHCNFVNLTAQHNVFKGRWLRGISSAANYLARTIRIDQGNTFQILVSDWEYGVYLERSQAIGDAHNFINGNTFLVTSSLSACIHVVDFVDASDACHIDGNTINVNALEGGTTGIQVRMGKSDKFHIHDNNIHFGLITTIGICFGIELTANTGQNLTFDHSVSHNTITGVSATNANNLRCGIHSESVAAVEYCENTVDQCFQGIHFYDKCAVELRSNHFNLHKTGLLINKAFSNDPQIGPQHSRGNRWEGGSTAITDKAAQISFPGNPVKSIFTYREGLTYPWKPDEDRLFPNPASGVWFNLDVSWPIDHICMQEPFGEAAQLTPYEKEVVLGTSPLTGTELGDLKSDVYVKLLLFPELRPSGSPEQAYFNTVTNTATIGLAQVWQQVRAANTLTAANQQALDNYHSAIEQARSNLATIDGSISYASATNLTPAWYTQRAVPLQQIATNENSRESLEATLAQQMDSGLQTALGFNASISTAQPYEAARKTISELRIRHLLRQPITQALYQQALAIAQQGEATAGASARDAVNFLSSCDQGQFIGEESVEDRKVESAGTLVYGKEALILMPNPSSGLVKVLLLEGKSGVLSVYSAAGQKVRSIIVAPDTGDISLDLSQMPRGIYQVVFMDANQLTIATAALSITH